MRLCFLHDQATLYGLFGALCVWLCGFVCTGCCFLHDQATAVWAFWRCVCMAVWLFLYRLLLFTRSSYCCMGLLVLCVYGCVALFVQVVTSYTIKLLLHGPFGAVCMAVWLLFVQFVAS